MSGKTILSMIHRFRFVLLAFLLLLSFVGRGSFCGIKIGSIHLVCPLGSLQVSLASLKIVAPVLLISLLIMSVIAGRIFCSVCPMGAVLDVFNRGGNRRSKINAVYSRKLMNLKYLVLVSVLIASLLLHFPVFCLICPFGIMYRLLFSGIPHPLGIAFFIFIILIEILVVSRGFCRYLCPLGAFFSALGRFSFFRITGCKSCGLCDCPFGVNPNSRECAMCGICMETCSHLKLEGKNWGRKSSSR